MDDKKKDMLSSLSNKVKDHAARSSDDAENDGSRRKISGFGSKPAAGSNAGTPSRKPH